MFFRDLIESRPGTEGAEEEGSSSTVRGPTVRDRVTESEKGMVAAAALSMAQFPASLAPSYSTLCPNSDRDAVFKQSCEAN